MKLYGCTFTYNEEKLIKYVMPYVERLGYEKFIVYDNHSTDNTVELLKQYPFVEVRTFYPYDESIRNQCFFDVYQEVYNMYLANPTEYYWMTITDFDEVIYVGGTMNLTWLLGTAAYRGYYVYDGQMINLITDEFPELPADVLLHEVVNKGSIFNAGAKPTLFLVNNLTEVKTSCGFHYKVFKYKDISSPKTFGNENSLYSFHLKYINLNYRIEQSIKNESNLVNDSHNKRKVNSENEIHTIKDVYSTAFDLKTYFACKAANSISLTSYSVFT